MKYLVQFAVSHEDFRIAELDSILLYCGVSPDSVYDIDAARKGFDWGSAFLICNLPNESVAREISERAILVKRVLELWGLGKTMEDTVNAVRSFPKKYIDSHLDKAPTWSINVTSSRYRITSEKQEKARRLFSFLPMRGRVCCKDPDITLFCIEEYDAEVTFREGREPLCIYFGREVGKSNRDLVGSRRLPTRLYLGPTSMDNELSIVMANMVQAHRGSLILDPFVGTGSILIAAAQFGAICVGTDIDPRPLHGKNGINIFSNFEQFGLPRPEIIRSDNSLYFGHFRDHSELYDGIVCDPPYGIRAGAKRTGSRRSEVRPVQDHQRWDHCPMTRPYDISDVLIDLIDTSANILKVGCRLCYLMPADYDTCTLDMLPGHPCMKLVGHSVQGLTKTKCRRLVTMSKICKYDSSLRDEYLEYARRGLTNSDVDDRVVVPGPSDEWKAMFLRRGKCGGTTRMTMPKDSC